MAATITFTQGDNNVVLNLTATDGNGNPINITGASFSTQILGPNNVGPVTFGNSQHALVSGPAGTFTLTLANNGGDTASCGIGENKDILTTVTLSSSVINLLGRGILAVRPPVPLQ